MFMTLTQHLDSLLILIIIMNNHLILHKIPQGNLESLTHMNIQKIINT